MKYLLNEKEYDHLISIKSKYLIQNEIIFRMAKEICDFECLECNVDVCYCVDDLTLFEKSINEMILTIKADRGI